MRRLLWLVAHDKTICIIEVQGLVQVLVDVNVEFFIYDTIDHDDFNFGSLRFFLFVLEGTHLRHRRTTLFQ